jgi:hypothetical protein
LTDTPSQHQSEPRQYDCYDEHLGDPPAASSLSNKVYSAAHTKGSHVAMLKRLGPYDGIKVSGQKIHQAFG